MTDLGKRIWKELEAPQGFAFIGAEVEEMDDDRALRIAMAAVSWHRECVKLLQQIIKDAQK